METKFESRVGTIKSSDEKIYQFLSNFNNFKSFIPTDKVDKFESSNDHCKFSVPNIGQINLRITEREPFKTIKVAGDGMANQTFVLWIQLKQASENDTKLKITMQANLNPMLKMMVSKPLQEFLNKLVDAIEKIPV